MSSTVVLVCVCFHAAGIELVRCKRGGDQDARLSCQEQVRLEKRRSGAGSDAQPDPCTAFKLAWP